MTKKLNLKKKKQNQKFPQCFLQQAVSAQSIFLKCNTLHYQFVHWTIFPESNIPKHNTVFI